jgi:hypothetical protein
MFKVLNLCAWDSRPRGITESSYPRYSGTQYTVNTVLAVALYPIQRERDAMAFAGVNQL